MFPARIHRYIFLFGIFGLAFGMMIGTVPTSVPQILLMGNWLIGMDFRNKWLRLKSNRIFWVLSSVFLAHVLGLFYTGNLQAGWDDVRTKIPLMFLPMLFFSEAPLTRKELHVILLLFLAGCVANTAWSLLYSYVLHPVDTVRNSSRFMSHIRLGLYLNLAIATVVYFLAGIRTRLQRGVLALLGVYYLLAMYLLGLATGMANFLILFFFFFCWIIYRQKMAVKIISSAVLVTAAYIAADYVRDIRNAQLAVKETPQNIPAKYAPSGRPYIHFDTSGQKENGHYVLMNIQLEELQREWKRDFPADSFSYQQQHNLGRYEILVRYMASRGLNKDSAAYATLSAGDKENIRKGISNYAYPTWSFLHRRIYELVNEHDEFVNHRVVNGHSLTMRLYFWQAAIKVVEQHPFFGVGTGDVQDALNAAYQNINSPLSDEWRKRPHNQFLTVTVALGLAGLLVFVFAVFYPAAALKKRLHVLFWPFFLLALLSFMLEDTLETQAGLTFYAFFHSLFISYGYHHGGKGGRSPRVLAGGNDG